MTQNHVPQDLQVGDIVRVVKHMPLPEPGTGGVPIDLLNEVAWIEQIKDFDGVKWAQINILYLDGSCGGCGDVPTGILALEPGSEWHAAKQQHDATMERLHQESEAYSQRVQRIHKRIARVADKYGVTQDIALHIYCEIAEVKG